MNHSTSKLWNKFQLLLRRMRWPWTCGCGKVSGVCHIGGPGCVGVERCLGYAILVGESRMCGTMLFVLKQN